MDDTRFDTLTRSLSALPTRRAALRLLAGSMVAGLLAQRGLPARALQRPDRDGDGLYDDDETDVYGTNPDIYDTDGDGVGDGEEVYLGTDPLTPAGGAPPPAAVCAQIGQSCAAAECCLGFCTQNLTCDCVNDGFACAGIGTGGCCSELPCNASGFCGSCSSLGARCNADAECCQGSYAALCCFNGTTLTTVCTDVTNIGFVCPGEAPAPAACPAGQTDCGGSCVDLSSHAGHCGACFTSCPQGGYCQDGFCGGFSGENVCPVGLTYCVNFGVAMCVDLNSDPDNCSACGRACFIEDATCVNGRCVD